MVQKEGQLAFDFTELEREDARGRLDEWAGAPLHFTTEFFAAAALDAAFEHWVFLNGRHGSHSRSHLWHRGFAEGNGIEIGEHRIDLFHADLSPERDAEGPGGDLTMAMCEHCRWHLISESESEAIEAWHDHALPGWRDLPVIPEQVRVRSEKGITKQGRTWIEENYPAHMQIPGAPIITERSAFATRHVPGVSPWRGYDLSATAVRKEEPLEDDDLAQEIAPRAPARSLTD